MAELPPEISEVVTAERIVHLVFRVAADWEGERERAVAEMEERIARVLAYARSGAYRERFGDRVPVLRMRTPDPPPSIVTALLKERGIEVDSESRPPAVPDYACVVCGRTGLAEEQVEMIDQGWACPSCLHGWRQVQGMASPGPAGRIRLSGGLGTALMVALLIVCAIGIYHALQYMSQMSGVIWEGVRK
jgi:hypothetical protein